MVISKFHLPFAPQYVENISHGVTQKPNPKVTKYKLQILIFKLNGNKRILTLYFTMS